MKLEEIVKKNGLNHQQLSEKTGVYPSYISKIANGKIAQNNFAKKYLTKISNVDEELI